MRILIIEDEAAISMFLKSSLEAEYFAVDVASDGEKGSYLAHINEYDLVILDNLLPKKDGITVCGELRASGRTMPILVISVKSETVKKVDLLDAGADDYLTKPFALDELLARVRALMRRKSAIESELLCVADLSLDNQEDHRKAWQARH